MGWAQEVPSRLCLEGKVNVKGRRGGGVEKEAGREGGEESEQIKLRAWLVGLLSSLSFPPSLAGSGCFVVLLKTGKVG